MHMLKEESDKLHLKMFSSEKKAKNVLIFEQFLPLTSDNSC